MADNFWDALEGKTSAAPASQEAPAFVPAPAASTPAFKRPSAASGFSKSSPESLAEKASKIEQKINIEQGKEKKKEDDASVFSQLDSYLSDILGVMKVPAYVGAGALVGEAARRTYKSLTTPKTTPLPMSQTGTEPTFNQPVATNATSAPAPQAASTVMTASGPVNLEEVPKAMRPIVEKSAQITQQKMGGPLVFSDIPEIPTLGSRPIAPSATPAPAAVAAPVAAPAGGAIPSVAPAAPSAAPAVQGAVAPEAGKAEKSMLNWVRGQMKQRGFTDMSDEAVKGFLKTFYGDAPIAPGAGYAPEGYGTRFAEWAKQNIAGPGVGMPREEMKAIKARDAVKPPSGQQGNASLGGIANVALNAAGGLMLLDMFKKAQQTGDYSDFALGAIGQVLGNVAPRGASIGFSLMQPNTVSSGTMDSPEAQEMMRRRNAGAGRGFVNPPMAR